MNTTNCPADGHIDTDLGDALEHLHKAEVDLARAHADEQRAEHEIADAIREIEHARNHHGPKAVEVTVDQRVHRLRAGAYLVSDFKSKVGVASDRELTELKAGIFQPLDDAATIVIEGCEIFVSHVRTGSSA